MKHLSKAVEEIRYLRDLIKLSKKDKEGKKTIKAINFEVRDIMYTLKGLEDEMDAFYFKNLDW